MDEKCLKINELSIRDVVVVGVKSNCVYSSVTGMVLLRELGPAGQINKDIEIIFGVIFSSLFSPLFLLKYHCHRTNAFVD